MAKFKVNTTFFIKSRHYFVISGELLNGTIKKGMYFHGRVDDYPIKFPINAINYTDGRHNGEPNSNIAICIKYSNEEEYSFLKALELDGVFSISSLTKRYSFEPSKQEFKVTAVYSAALAYIISAKLIHGKGLVPGLMYRFTARQAKRKHLSVLCVKKSSNSYKFKIFNNTPNVKSGMTLESEVME